jgi:hypothetical protein
LINFLIAIYDFSFHIPSVGDPSTLLRDVYELLHHFIYAQQLYLCVSRPKGASFSSKSEFSAALPVLVHYVLFSVLFLVRKSNLVSLSYIQYLFWLRRGPGLKRAKTKGTFWQRCILHFLGNRRYELQSKRHHWKNYKFILYLSTFLK